MANPGPASTQTTNLAAPMSNHYKLQTLSVNLGTIAAIGAATSAEQTFSGLGTGILTGDVIVNVSKPTAQAGLGIVGVRNDAAVNDKFYVTFMNATAGALTPTASETYFVTVARPIPGSTPLSAVA